MTDPTDYDQTFVEQVKFEERALDESDSFMVLVDKERHEVIAEFDSWSEFEDIADEMNYEPQNTTLLEDSVEREAADRVRVAREIL